MTNSARRLLLLRHAKAEPHGTVPDELRRLDPRGRHQATSVGTGLRTAALQPETVLVSSAVRARETWEHVASTLADEPAPDVVLRDDLYWASVEDVVEILRNVDARVRTVLVVAHEPTMSETAVRLAGSGSPEVMNQVRHGLPTASYALLDVPTTWAELEPMGAVLRDVVRPAWRD